MTAISQKKLRLLLIGRFSIRAISLASIGAGLVVVVDLILVSSLSVFPMYMSYAVGFATIIMGIETVLQLVRLQQSSVLDQRLSALAGDITWLEDNLKAEAIKRLIVRLNTLLNTLELKGKSHERYQ